MCQDTAMATQMWVGHTPCPGAAHGLDGNGVMAKC